MWSLFLRGAPAATHELEPNPDPSLITELNWELANHISTAFPQFNEFA